ncbi:hypothetical protein BCR36DRAFT_252403, partial [Piromyces finnis]
KQNQNSLDIDNDNNRLFSNLEPNSKENNYQNVIKDISNGNELSTASVEKQIQPDNNNELDNQVSLNNNSDNAKISSTSKISLKSIMKNSSRNLDDRIRNIEDEPEKRDHPEKKKKIIRKVKRIIINKKTGEKKEIVDNFVTIVGEKEGNALIKKKKLASMKPNMNSSTCSLYNNKKLYPGDNKKYKVMKKTVKVTKKKDYSGELDLDEEELKKIEDEKKKEE